MSERIEILEYDLKWPEVFGREADALKESVGELILQIEHVGSTSVPGLAAKPIVDIMVAVAELDSIGPAIPNFEKLGYEHCGEMGVPGRIFFKKYIDGKRAFHIHTVEPDTNAWFQLVPFRDYLIAHPDEAREYEKLKRKLAVRFEHNRDAYSKQKHSFIDGILQKLSS